MKKLWILGFGSALFVLASPGARASVIDWNAAPAGTLAKLAKQPGAYTTGHDFAGVTLTVAGSNGATAFPFGSAGLQTPAITNTIFSGGQLGRNLSTVALFSPTGVRTITFTIDFFGFKQGVKDVSFDMFDVDMNTHGSVHLDEVVSFKTAGLTLTGSADNVVSGNKVTGITTSPNTGPGSGAANVLVKSGSMPLHEIVFTFSTLSTNISALEGIGIGNLSFTPVPEVGQLAIGLAACLIGAVWLWRNRRERSPSIA